MRVPRHDTSLRLPAEAPRGALASDEAMLDLVQPGGPWLVRGYVPASSAVVLGLGMGHRAHEVIDLARCAAAGIDVVRRRAGGGAVLVDPTMVCGAICAPLPHPLIADDLTASYRWLGEQLAAGLRSLGVSGARPAELAEARADIHALRSSADARSELLLTTCYGALSPYEIVDGSPPAKLVGLAQVRRRHAALFQFGILLRDQQPLADLLVVPDEPTREVLRAALRTRTVGLTQLVDSSELMQKIASLSVFAEPWAASDAMPCAP